MDKPSDILVGMVERHTDRILGSIGTRLKSYTPETQGAAKLSVLEAVEEAYRAGAQYGVEQARKRMAGTAPEVLAALEGLLAHEPGGSPSLSQPRGFAVARAKRVVAAAKGDRS